METARIEVGQLYVGLLNSTPTQRDWSEGWPETWEFFAAPTCGSCGKYGRWNHVLHEWLCPSDPQDCDHGDSTLDNDTEGPMMNYSYPLEDLGQARDEYDAADRIRDLPLCLVSFEGGGYALALTGGGMDLSWEICEAYTRLGFLPPLHFCDLPRMAGYPHSESQRYVLAACKRSAMAASAQLRGIRERLDSFHEVS